MPNNFALKDAETVEYEGKRYQIDRVTFKAGLRNAPLRVWCADGEEIHWRPQTGESLVVDLETGDTTFVEPIGKDGDTVVLEEARRVN